QSISEFTQWNGFPILNGTAGERVGERPVYKVASSGNFVASDTFEAGIPTTSEALNKVSVSGPGLFTMAGQLRVVPDVSATFTKPDGTIIDLMDPPDDVDVEDWITVVGNEITIKAASGLVDGNVVLTQTVREDDTDADYAGETIILSTKMPTVEAMQANDIIINGITIGAADGLADTVSAGSSVSASAISRAAAINEKTAQTGVVAVVKTNVMTGAQMVGGEPISGTLTINGYTSARITTTLNNVRESRTAVVDAINAISAQTGVVAINTNSDAEGVRLEALDGRNIELSFNTDSDTEDFSAATGLRQGLQIGSYSLESTVEGPVVVTTTSTTDWSRAGIRPGNYTENTSVYTSGVRDLVADANDIKTLGDGDLSINGIAIRGAMAQDDTRSSVAAATSSRTGSAIAIAAAINASAAQTSVQASVAPASTVATEGPTIIQGGTATVYLNGEPVRIDLSEDDDATTRLNKIITAINLQGGQHGVLAEKTSDGRLMLSTPDGRNLSVWFDSDDWDASELGLEGSAATGISGATETSDGASTVYGSVLLRSDKAFTLAPGANGFNSDGDFDALKFQQGTYGGLVDESTSKMTPPRTGRLSFHVGASATQTIHIDFADYGSKGPITGGVTGDVELSNTAQRVNRIDTVAGAQAVLAKLDVALDKVNGNRAVMGAVMNRLDYIMDNLSNVAMNTTASRSQIEDADYAKASTDLARTQIMQQAATAVLAQANMDQQTVLKLLQ
ncbi:MAG: hypothetical protein RL513_1279, partial [Pseudomonadota bacterium]